MSPAQHRATIDGVAHVLCAICGWSIPWLPRKGHTREHLGQRGDLRRCFANDDKALIAWAHPECNSLRGTRHGHTLDRMRLWSLTAMHPNIRRQLPKGRPHSNREIPGRNVKRGQGAWK